MESDSATTSPLDLAHPKTWRRFVPSWLRSLMRQGPMSKEATNHEPSAYIRTRNIRVFISSTFRDMQAERDILIKRIFPQLRKLCEERAVTWTEVDLRWGITTEQAAEGKVLPLCLEEIHRCRPYFIGLLGERYGWMPQPNLIPFELIEARPWLKQHLQHSVTELEILHGVFNEEPMHGHAYFYFRDPKYLNSVAADKRQDFTSENPAAAGKLAKLKQKIRCARDEQVCELRENYANPEQLGEWILEDFKKMIDRLYPKDQTPHQLDQEAARHEAYARSRRLAFIGREDLLCRLDEHAAAHGKPLVLTGESGCGKSALLAEWVACWSKAHPDDLIIQHYIGSTPDSADWPRLVRRIVSELKRAFTIPDEIPIQPDALRTALHEWITKCADPRRHVIIVLDALNQIAEDGTARQLDWLPTDFPPTFSVIVSSLPGESLAALRKRGWRELNVPLFSRADIAPAALSYFKIFSKTPPSDIVARMEATPAACNALYLRAVMDELRQYGKHEEIEATAASYLSAPDIAELFDRILARWEMDYGVDLARNSLTLIWAARRGLSEAEILDLLGKQPTCDVFGAYSRLSEAEMLTLLKEIREPREPMPRSKWTPFFFASESGFIVQAGLLTFSHSYLRKAVEKRYLPTPEAKRSVHERLALYFELSPLATQEGADGSIHFDEDFGTTLRALDEEPWQLQAACRWDALANHLSFLPVFRAAHATGREFEWIQYWQQVLTAVKNGSIPPVDIPTLYMTGFRQLSSREKMFMGGTLGQFLYALGYYGAAAECFEMERNADAEVGAIGDDRFIRAGILNDKGLIERDRGLQHEALKLFAEAAAILESTEGEIRSPQDERRLLASILLNQVSVTRDNPDKSQCRPMLERALNLMKETTGERSPEVATVLQGIGNLAMAQEDFKEALSFHTQAHAIRREKLGREHRDIGLSLGNIANTLARMERYHYAVLLYERALEILKNTVGHDHQFARNVSMSLEQCKVLEYEAKRNESRFGLVLLVFNSLSPSENPPDPATEEGAKVVARGICDTLTEIWDEAFARRTSFPVLVISCPAFETTISIASETSIAKRFSDNLLTWLSIPAIAASFESPEALIPLLPVRQTFVAWLQKHDFDVLTVKPVAASGATLDWRFLEFVRQRCQTDPNGSVETLSRRSNELDRELHPMAVEIVPFDELDGPLMGLYTGDHDPRSCVLPASDWRQQKYSPQVGDERATGVFYLNLAGIRQWLAGRPVTGLTPLDEWSMRPLLSMAKESREDQLRIFESAFSELVLLVKTRPVRCPPERGVRGFLPNSLYRDVEDLLN
jgi:nephrocystin-3